MNFDMTTQQVIFGAEFDCTYGASKIQNTCYYYQGWYCVHGSTNVNLTYEEFFDGIDVEEVPDIDMFTWSSPINSLDELINAVEN